MDMMDKVDLIKKNTVEILVEDDLVELIKSKKDLKGYIGFEPSGKVHLGWKICVNKIKDLLNAQVDMTILLATYHAAINDKFGGDIDKIKACAEYMKHCFWAMGLPRSARFVFVEDIISNLGYWEKVLKIAKKLSLARVKRAMTIMGRHEEELDTDFSKCIYPCLQVADIFELDSDICYGGIDQRRAHVLAREIAPKLEFKKPIAIHTPLLIGLTGASRMDMSTDNLEIEAKMSKSDPLSCIYIHDSEEEIKTKIKKAFCQEGDVQFNPILDIVRYIILPEHGELNISRKPKFGGNVYITEYEQLEEMFSKKELHPLDLKMAVADSLIKILKPVRDYFAQHKDILALVDEDTISR